MHRELDHFLSMMWRYKLAVCNLKEGPHQNSTTLAPLCWNLSLQNCEKQTDVVQKSLSLWYFVIAARHRQILTELKMFEIEITITLTMRLPSTAHNLNRHSNKNSDDDVCRQRPLHHGCCLADSNSTMTLDFRAGQIWGKMCILELAAHSIISSHTVQG